MALRVLGQAAGLATSYSLHHNVPKCKELQVLQAPGVSFSWLPGMHRKLSGHQAEQLPSLTRCFILLPARCPLPCPQRSGRASNKLCFKERNRKRQRAASRLGTARFPSAGKTIQPLFSLMAHLREAAVGFSPQIIFFPFPVVSSSFILTWTIPYSHKGN